MSDGGFEKVVEEAALEWFRGVGWSVAYGPDLAPGGSAQERDSYRDVVLVQRLRDAVDLLNPQVPAAARDRAVAKVLAASSPSLVEDNRAFHRMLVEGVPVDYQRDGRIVYDKVQLVDFERPERNDFLVANQVTVENTYRDRPPRRADTVAFVNGLPIAVLEYKSATDRAATIDNAFNQIQTYKNEIGPLFRYNEVNIISDGTLARVGSLTADRERFMPWRTIDGRGLAPTSAAELEVVIDGLFEHSRLLRYIRDFVVFEDDLSGTIKKLAGYHQFRAVLKAVAATLEATKPDGDRKAGVVWHTQGSGKSLAMVFYAGEIIQHPAMENPTLVVITDRNDLDDQLFGVFARCQDLLRQAPAQAESREDLQRLLRVASGGVIFTTIQKFMPEAPPEERSAPKDKRTRALTDYPLLSDRRNIVVIADEAHRSQYDFVDGFAAHMRKAVPNASYIGFTGTPIELADKSTKSVFGDYIDIYDIQQSEEDQATVPIYYESRLARIELLESEKPVLDEEFAEVTEGEEETRQEQLKTKWAAFEAVVGTEKRIAQVEKDIVEHFEQRQEVMRGKAMIVATSRRIAADLYDAIALLRPDWVADEDANGKLKVVMTGSASDPQNYQPHIRSKTRRKVIEKRFKDPQDELQIVIVRDMWLTGFDVPSLHTMYLDKYMKGHTLMQAIARVNRVFRDKPGGLIVDYLGIAHELRKALSIYSQSGGRGKVELDQELAVEVMQESIEILRAIFYGLDYSVFLTGTATERVSIIKAAVDHVLSVQDGKDRFRKASTKLSRAFALASPHEASLAARNEVLFFQAVRASLDKVTGTERKSQSLIDEALAQLISQAVVTEEVQDVLAMAGLEKPDISVLSDEFLAGITKMPQRNLAVEMLQRLLKDQISLRMRKNLVKARSFAEMLERTINGYHNRVIETAQVIEMLIELAKEMREADARGEQLGLTEDELALYDALEVNDSAVKVLGDEVLRTIAHEMVETVRSNTSIDWAVRESAKAKLRVAVKRILRKYGYPPDKQEKAVRTVLEQAEAITEGIYQR